MNLHQMLRLGHDAPCVDLEPNIVGGNTMSDNKDVLTEAAEIINGQRRDDYESFTRIAQLWSAYLGHPVNMLDVANMMVLLKVSRTRRKYHRDSYTDICGYAALAEKLRT